jgi:RNA polymerase sigma-70 factor (ECF subfamily)
MIVAAQPISTSDDRELLDRVRAGDERAFEALVRRHGSRMLTVARRFLSCDQDSEDAVQDALISAYRSIGDFDGKSQLATWLHRITVNACLMKIRSRSRRPESSIDNLLPQFDDTGHRVSCDPAWSDGFDRLARNDLQRLVRACIDKLPAPYRVVLLLRDIEELDTAETARRLKCSAASVKTRLHRARQALRTLLTPYASGDGSELGA